MFAKIDKKGFTLIEMMAVIAIIAVLVSVVMPTFGESKNKANAATNAANLRTIESQLAQMLVTNPGAFEKDPNAQFIEDLIGDLNVALDTVIRPSLAAAEKVVDSMLNPKPITIPFIGTITPPPASEEEVAPFRAKVQEWQKLIAETEEVRDRKIYLYQHSYTAVDGIITLDDGTTISAPPSQSLDVDGMTVAKDIQMTVVVSDTEIIAYYNGLSKDVFGLVAASGSSADISDTKHDYVDGDGNGTCDVCGNNKNHNKYEVELN